MEKLPKGEKPEKPGKPGKRPPPSEPCGPQVFFREARAEEAEEVTVLGVTMIFPCPLGSIYNLSSLRWAWDAPLVRSIRSVRCDGNES